MKIGVIGLGVVGSAVAKGFSFLGHSIFSYDKKNSNQTIQDVLTSDCIFVCVPTNELPDGSCDLTEVHATLENLQDNQYAGTIIIKSTVSPGTTEQLITKYKNTNICFVPEFLRQDYADIDFMSNQNVLIIGTHSDEVYKFVENVHSELINDAKKVTPTEAELSKYFCNNFNALRIIFANTFYEVCQSLGADYQNVLDSAVTRPSLGNDAYLKCNESLRGFSGACLPKDTAAFGRIVDQLGIPVNLISAIMHDNQYYNGVNTDGPV